MPAGRVPKSQVTVPCPALYTGWGWLPLTLALSSQTTPGISVAVTFADDRSLDGLTKFQRIVKVVLEFTLGGNGPLEPKTGSFKRTFWTNVGEEEMRVTNSLSAVSLSISRFARYFAKAPKKYEKDPRPYHEYYARIDFSNGKLKVSGYAADEMTMMNELKKQGKLGLLKETKPPKDHSKLSKPRKLILNQGQLK